MSTMNINKTYQISPFQLHPFGAEIWGIDLKENIDHSTIEQIQQDVQKHRILIFKDQGIVSGSRQVEISRWFGELEIAGFERHQKSPSDFILRVSNDEEEGFRDFGTSGFHIDGSFMEMPNAYSIYHIICVPTKGDTVFVPLNEVYEGLTDRKKEFWQQIWILKKYPYIKRHRDTPGHVTHPLVYTHPTSQLMTLCLHQGRTKGFLRNKNTPHVSRATQEETQQLLTEIDTELHRDNGALQYAHKWQAGDLIISDNLAVAHWATPDTQLPPSQVQLRVMHRTIVKGTTRPTKTWTKPS